MSDQASKSASGAPAPASDSPGKPPRTGKPSTRPARPRRGVLAPLALVLALLALAGVAFGGWQWWQARQGRQNDADSLAALRQQVQSIQAQVDSRQQRQAQEWQAASAANQALRQQVEGWSERTRNLEGAVADLVRHDRSGRRTLLLDQAEMLLRMGQQRYTLFHDGAGALKALALADQTLAAVDDPALSGVRQTLDAERKTLAATHPASRAADLATLARLRGTIATLPLKPLDDQADKAPRGFWQRLWHALSTAVVVRHVGKSPQGLADAHLTRQLAALDVAQAEAARLAWDSGASHAALERVARALDTAFDTHDAAVRKARADVARLLDEPQARAPELGQALRELRNLRAVQDGQAPATLPSAPASAPAPPAPAGAVPARTGSSA